MFDALVAAIRELQSGLADARAENAALKARMDRMFRYGKVTDVSADGTQYRQEIGVDDDGNPVKSPWIRHSQIAGGLKVHTPPDVGQGMMMISPNGDFEQAIGIPHSWSDANATPGQGKSENALTYGPFRLSLDEAALKISGPKVSITSDVEIKGNVSMKDGTLTHEGKNVGADHVHDGVEPGGGNTGEPV